MEEEVEAVEGGVKGARRLDANPKDDYALRAAEWGLTPGRVTTLVKSLISVAEEWGEEAKHFR